MATTQGREYANGNEKTRIPSLLHRRPDLTQHNKSLSMSTLGPPDHKYVAVSSPQKHVPTLSAKKHVPTSVLKKHVPTSSTKKHVPTSFAEKHVPTSSAKKHVPNSFEEKCVPTSSSGEHFPNYLRPTKCSGHGHSMHSKRQASNNTARKPNLNRRSFDKPALPSPPLHKALTSQNPREKKFEPSSISPKATTLARTQSLNLSKAQRNIAKPISIKTRPVPGKKSTNTTLAKKQNSPNSTAAKIKAPISSSADLAMTQQPISLHEDQKSSATDVGEEVVKFENNFHDFPNEILILEDKGQVLDLVESEHGMDIDEELRSFESFSVLEHENASFSLEMGQSIDKTNVEGTEHDYIQEGGDHGTEDTVDSHPEDQSFVIEPKVEEEVRKIEEDATENSSGGALDAKEVVDEGSRNNEKEVIDAKEVVDEGSRNNENEVVDAKEAVDEGSNEKEVVVAKEVVDEGSLNNEKEVVEDIAKEEKAERSNVAVKQQVAQAKEDSAANNKVIEELPRKPVQKRRNKVSALVGAFEHVMSLQEPKNEA